MKIPLKNQLRSPHAALAQLQDEALDIFYTVAPEAVLHGGTAIWRCYGGKRFSEDLDFYAPADRLMKEKLGAESAKRSLVLTKFRETRNALYSRISDGRTEVSIEATLRPSKRRILSTYERADGSTNDIYTLAREDLIIEKAHAFASRKLIRDIYDVYFLSGTADLKNVRSELLKFLEKIPQPADEKNLRTLVYSGPCPSFSDMVSALERRLKA
ncbi:Nucleotidyl transferase AbiEii toxin, Type IV TA system [uncultured archaeon]|nr:Nucleotidyl transferase AbiEii toxin, Type IV TA system [uncultured archaeon]